MGNHQGFKVSFISTKFQPSIFSCQVSAAPAHVAVRPFVVMQRAPVAWGINVERVLYCVIVLRKTIPILLMEEIRLTS